MDIETSSAVKLFFPNPSLTLVYFEALANSFDAGASEITVTIKIESFDKPETLRVAIADNGDGFSDDNFDRFKTLLKPRDKFHKGIGRLVFLNYFSRVEISSVWGACRRTFTFRNGFDGHAPVECLDEEHPKQTELIFAGFAKDRVKAYEDLKPAALKLQIIEHFFPTLQKLKREGVDFKVEIKLETAQSNAQKEFFSDVILIGPADLPDMKMITIQDDLLDFVSDIEMYYHIKPVAGKGNQLVAFSIDGRTIPAKLIPQSSFPQGYSCFFLFESDIFHSNADSSRQKLILPEGIPESQFYHALRKELGRVLTEHVPLITEKNSRTTKQFEEMFPHLLGYFEKNTVGLIDKDEALTIAQQRFFQNQKEVLQSETLNESTFEKSLELSSRSLTQYILYRDKIIKRLKSMTEDDAEADIHNLIVPRYRNFNHDSMPSDVYQNNAWLLDDKFMVFRTILSEKRMDDVINAIKLDDDFIEESGRPDIAMIFSADPKDDKAVDVVVVEIKKKTDDEKENQYAINQLLDRAVKLAAHCPNIQRIWYYAVVQISDTLATRLRQQKWAPLFSMGKVYYQEFQTERPDGSIVPTPTFAVSFDAVVSDAECRNHTFLEILRGGMKRYAQAKNNP
jgi:hypothetical protein